MTTLSAEQLYMQLGQLVEQVPAVANSGPLPEETLRWLGRAHALVMQTHGAHSFEPIQFNGELQKLNTTERMWAFQNIRTMVYKALAHAEVGAPAAVQGMFLPVGSPFDALAAIGKVLQGASSYARIIDPYLDASALTDFAVLARETVPVQLLADEAHVKPSLKPAYERWCAQYGASRPAEARLAAPRTLHDRLIEVDGKTVWIVTQSLNGLAARSPGSVTRASTEVAQLKMAFYASAWSAARPL
jgi:hypothetical protein